MSNQGGGSSQPLRDARRQVNHAQRDLTRIGQKLKQDEKSLEMQIKAEFKKGNQTAGRSLTKLLIQNRRQQEQLQKQSVQFGALPGKLAMQNAQAQTGKAMGRVSKVMTEVNKQSDPKKMMKTAQEFQKQSDMMSMGQEIFDDAFETTGEEDEEADQILQEVLDGVGLEIASKPIPSNKASTPASAAITAEDEEVEAMLQALRT